MNNATEYCDVLVIGSGPAGMNAACVAAEAGARVVVVERLSGPGGACVKFDAIPSKMLRETALAVDTARRHNDQIIKWSSADAVPIEDLLRRTQSVVTRHQDTTKEVLRQNRIDLIHGNAELVAANTIAIESNQGDEHLVTSRLIVIATGARPKLDPRFPVDHTNILDSDSVLSMTYLPRSLAVVGSGAVACEYASIFATLGVRVELIGLGARPLCSFEPEFTDLFLQAFTRRGGQYHAQPDVVSMAWDGVCAVRTEFAGGQQVVTDKALIAVGRTANVESLNLDGVGVELTETGNVQVDELFQTTTPNILAVGDVIGSSEFASCSMAQGRAAMQFALGNELDRRELPVPTGVYTIPELATVGLDETRARKHYGAVRIGRVCFRDTSRGQIQAVEEGVLKLIATSRGRLIGVQIFGAGATELIHLGQMAMAGGLTIQDLASAPLNFPTYAECYRRAALAAIRDHLVADAEPVP